MRNNIKNNRGFTIVELLIVIVVIAILAAISIVAYNGIQARARATAAQSAATSLDKKVEIYNAINTQYPTVVGTITGTGTQNGVTTSSTSDWYAAPGSAFTVNTGVAAATTGMYSGLAAPADPKTVYYTGIVAAAPTTSGGCIWWYDYQNTTWKSQATGAVTCPALPVTQAASLASVAL